VASLCVPFTPVQVAVSPLDHGKIKNPETQVLDVGKVVNPMKFQSSPSVEGGTFLDPRGVNPNHVGDNRVGRKARKPTKQPNGELAATEFADIFSRYLSELGRKNGRQEGP